MIAIVIGLFFFPHAMYYDRLLFSSRCWLGWLLVRALTLNLNIYNAFFIFMFDEHLLDGCEGGASGTRCHDTSHEHTVAGELTLVEGTEFLLRLLHAQLCCLQAVLRGANGRLHSNQAAQATGPLICLVSASFGLLPLFWFLKYRWRRKIILRLNRLFLGLAW